MLPVNGSDRGVFARILFELARESNASDTPTFPSRQIATRSPAGQWTRPIRKPPAPFPALGSKRGLGRLIGCTKGGLNTKRHTIIDAPGRPIRMFLSGRHTSEYIGARALVDELPDANVLLAERGCADRGYDADWFRNALKDTGIAPCIPSRKIRKVPIPHDANLRKKRDRIENSFARLKARPASLPATTAAPRPSSPYAPSQPSSSSGYGC